MATSLAERIRASRQDRGEPASPQSYVEINAIWRVRSIAMLIASIALVHPRHDVQKLP
jgi:hypothetical protein